MAGLMPQKDTSGTVAVQALRGCLAVRAACASGHAFRAGLNVVTQNCLPCLFVG